MFVVPAKAGTQWRSYKRHWIPSPLSRGLKAAGMTVSWMRRRTFLTLTSGTAESHHSRYAISALYRIRCGRAPSSPSRFFLSASYSW